MKAQIKQVFIWGMMIILIGFVMLIALRSFGRIDETRCSAEKITFQTDLNKELEENYMWGREKIVTIGKPCDYEVICFVDRRSIANLGTVLTTFTDNDGFDLKSIPKYNEEIILDSVKEGIQMNIFLLKKDFVEPYAYNDKIQLDDTTTIPTNAFCIPAKGGKFKFKLEGQGRYLVVRPAPTG